MIQTKLFWFDGVLGDHYTYYLPPVQTLNVERYLGTARFLNGPSPASLLFTCFRSFHTIFRKIVGFSGIRTWRRACWPLDHHHGFRQIIRNFQLGGAHSSSSSMWGNVKMILWWPLTSDYYHPPICLKDTRMGIIIIFRQSIFLQSKWELSPT